MPIDIRMPALSPTMEEGTLAKWLVKAGDAVRPGDLIAEVETDKATMEFEAVDEGVIAGIAVAEGTDGVKVGTVIATLATHGEETPFPAATSEATRPADPVGDDRPERADPVTEAAKGGSVSRDASAAAEPAPMPQTPSASGISNANATSLARRLAMARGVDLAGVTGTGLGGQIVRADVDGGKAVAVASASALGAPASTLAPKPVAIPDIPHQATKLSNMRKTIARRLTESKQQVPHIYLTVDIRLDALLALRGDLNAGLAARGTKLSVNDLMIKALAVALVEVPSCNVMFTPDQLVSFSRADISVAVSTPSGLITPVIVGADTKSLSAISTEMKQLAALARDGKLKPEQYQGGTASLSNMGMYGITMFDAVINPPQAMILAIGAGDQRPCVIADAPGIATVMSATGSFDHRAIDGAHAAQLMQAFKRLVEVPATLLA